MGVWTAARSKRWDVARDGLTLTERVAGRAIVVASGETAGAAATVLMVAFAKRPAGCPPKRSVWSITLAEVMWRAKLSPMGESGWLVPGKSGVLREPVTQASPLSPALTVLCDPGTRSVEADTAWPLVGIFRRL